MPFAVTWSDLRNLFQHSHGGVLHREELLSLRRFLRMGGDRPREIPNDETCLIDN